VFIRCSRCFEKRYELGRYLKAAFDV